MVIGIDVTHPSHTKLSGAKSVAGVVANTKSMDFAQWPCSLRTQTSRQEIVEDLQEMVEERLTVWMANSKTALPKRILVYRDGVAEGQYKEVLNKELPRIRNACAKKSKMAKPIPIMFVIVAKRHHTRFYPMNNEGSDDKGNPRPGTVVDRGITMERGWDFFLQAHACLQGTAKPAHYVVLHSDIGKGIINAGGLETIVSNNEPHPFAHIVIWLIPDIRRHTSSATSLDEQPRQSRSAHRRTMHIWRASVRRSTCFNITNLPLPQTRLCTQSQRGAMMWRLGRGRSRPTYCTTPCSTSDTWKLVRG